MLIAASVAIVATAAIVAPKFLTGGAAANPSTGHARRAVESRRACKSFVDGVERGNTPARLSLTPGAHILELRGRGVPRVIPFNVAAGAEVSQYLEFADTPETGSLRVQSRSGRREGASSTAPIAASRRSRVTDLAPGDHEVVLQTRRRHRCDTSSSCRPASPPRSSRRCRGRAAAGPVSGWLTVKAPFTLEIREDGQLLGTTDSDRS